MSVTEDVSGGLTAANPKHTPSTQQLSTSNNVIGRRVGVVGHVGGKDLVEKWFCAAVAASLAETVTMPLGRHTIHSLSYHIISSNPIQPMIHILRHPINQSINRPATSFPPSAKSTYNI
jgi:hypothetical protein